jgi:hypothetical protein
MEGKKKLKIHRLIRRVSSQQPLGLIGSLAKITMIIDINCQLEK